MQVKFIDKNKDRNLFLTTLKQRVDNYFDEQNITMFCNKKMVIKTIVLLNAYILPFIVILTFHLSALTTFLLWSLMGFALAGIGMSVMHDANHGAYSSNKKVNIIMGHTLNLLGGAVFNWKLQHNILHHTYTNVVHKDDDIDDKLIMRFSPHTTVKWYHKFQFVYAFAFYGILTLYWALLKDFVQFFQYTKEGVNRDSKNKNRQNLLKVVASKLFYFFVFIVLPLVILKMSVLPYLMGFLLMHFIAGIVLTVIFQLAHTVEGTNYPLPDESGIIENNWAIHQLNTTVNFSRKNKWLSWYVGGLNFQVEHHLFPAICHVHYPAIAPIVKSTAEEFGIPYLENKSFMEALRSHINVLKTFGRLPGINEAIS